MMSSLENAKILVELVGGTLAVVGIIYRVSKIESAIYSAIDALKDAVSDRLNSQETQLRLHMQSYIDKNEMVDYRLAGLDQKINHKFERLFLSLQDVQRYLEKTGSFQVRQRLTSLDSSQEP